MLPAADRRVEQDDAFTLTVHVQDDSGNLADADGDVDVAVTDEGGNTTHSALISVSDSTGVYTTEHPAHSTLETLTADISYTVGGQDKTDVRVIEVVGFRLPALHLLRAEIDDERAEAGLSSLDAVDLERVSHRTEDAFASILGYAPMEVGKDVTRRIRGRSMRLAEAPFLRSVREISAYWDNGNQVTNFDATDVRVRDFKLQRAKGGHFPKAYAEMVVTTGRWTDAAPTDLERAAVKYGAHIARQSELPARAREVETDGAFITLATPSGERPTGLPEVDGVVNRYRFGTVIV